MKKNLINKLRNHTNNSLKWAYAESIIIDLQTEMIDIYEAKELIKKWGL